MKVLNYGSLNYDHVYQNEHFVQEKETISSLSYRRGFGGKGLNQSIALAKANVQIYHAGKVGNDGQDFIDYLKSYNVNTGSYVFNLLVKATICLIIPNLIFIVKNRKKPELFNLVSRLKKIIFRKAQT